MEKPPEMPMKSMYPLYVVHISGESSLLIGKLGKSMYARNEPAIIAEI